MVEVDTVYKADILHPSPFRFELKYKGVGWNGGDGKVSLGDFFIGWWEP